MEHHIELAYLVHRGSRPRHAHARSSAMSSASCPASRARRRAHLARRRPRRSGDRRAARPGERRRRRRFRGGRRRGLRRDRRPARAPTGADVADGDRRRPRSAAGRPAGPHHGAVGRRRRARARARRRADAVRVAARARRLPHRGRRLRARRVRHDRVRRVASRSSPTGLGLAQSDWLEMELAPGHRRSRCASTTATRATTPSRSRGRRSSCRSALHHVMFETNERDDVGAAFDRAWATDLADPERARPPRQRRHVQLLRADARPASRSRSVTARASSPTTGTTTAATTASAPGATSRCARHEHDVDVDADVAIVGAGPVGLVLGDPARAARTVGRGPRAVARALPAAARRALRPRGRPHPPVVRHRRRAARDLANRPRSTSGATPRARRCCASVASATAASGWPFSSMFCQPELEALLERARRVAADARRSGAASRSTALEQHDDHVVVGAASRRRGPRRATSSAATARTAPCATLLGIAVDDLGFFYDWLIVDVDPRRAARVRSDQPPDLRSGAGRRPRCRAGPAAGAGSSCACPTRRSTSSNDEATRVGAARAVGRAPRQRARSNATPSTRSRPAYAEQLAGRARASSPATPRT